MDLLIIRHGHAEYDIPQKTKRLTSLGRSIFRNKLHNNMDLFTTLDFIISSPIIRAQETAEILKSVSNCKNEIILDQRLTPGTSTEEILDLVNEMAGNSIALISHLPDVSFHLNKLVSKPNVRVNFEPGTIAMLKFNGKFGFGLGELYKTV